MRVAPTLAFTSLLGTGRFCHLTKLVVRHRGVDPRSTRRGVQHSSSILQPSLDDESPGFFAALFDLPATFNGTGVAALSRVGCVRNGNAVNAGTGAFIDRLVVGTKRGDVAILDIDVSQRNVTRVDTFHAPAARLPVYCFAADDATLWAGGGDRYISVWPTTRQDNGSNHPNPKRLGPHTGWVKAVALDASRCDDGKSRGGRLYSIGCNRIETWISKPTRPRNGAVIETSNDSRDGPPTEEWLHEGTIAVESGSVSQGACTLSSDLLCLAVCRIPGSNETYIAAGGVDGRLQFYNGALPSLHRRDPLASTVVVAAHDGRVNAIAFNADTQLLCSASHDGTVRCWSLVHTTTDPPRLNVQLVALFHLNDNVRVSALATWTTPCPNSSSTLYVAVGTQTGSVHTLRLQDHTGVTTSVDTLRPRWFEVVQNWQVGPNHQHGRSIHAICPFAFDASGVCAFAIGHSHGLSIITK